jgi:hypothetical protein
MEGTAVFAPNNPDSICVQTFVKHFYTWLWVTIFVPKKGFCVLIATA